MEIARPDLRIARVTEAAEVHRGAELFDAAPADEATIAFLAAPGHHLLFAYDGAGIPVGMITGVETIHPDKGTEMFVYELGVAESARQRGVGRALVDALARLARDRGCYGMWVLTDPDNAAALATYRGGGAAEEALAVMLSFDLSDE